MPENNTRFSAGSDRTFLGDACTILQCSVIRVLPSGEEFRMTNKMKISEEQTIRMQADRAELAQRILVFIGDHEREMDACFA